MPLEWTNDLAVGVEEIDNQHKELFRRINNLLDACVQGKGKDEVLSILKFLDDYVIVHFTAEEGLQKRYNYPNYTSHKTLHAEFKKSIYDIKKMIKDEGFGPHLIFRMHRTVVDWWFEHIGRADKEFGSFLQGKI